jgi:hypothetical protein
MAITTLAGAVAGLRQRQLITSAWGTQNMQGNQTLWTAMTFFWSGSGTAGAGGGTFSQSSSLVSGAIPFYDPASGNSYLAGWSWIVNSNNIGGGLVFLADRLWDSTQNTTPANYSVTSTASQTVNSVAWPARDAAGSTNGQDVLLGMRLNTGTAGTGCTLTYTNSAGVGSRTAQFVNTTPTAPNGYVCPWGLQAGDVGVQSIQSIQLASTMTSGSFYLFAWRFLCMMEFYSAYQNRVDALTSGFPRLYNGTTPMCGWVGPNNSANGLGLGQMLVTQG